MVNKRNGSDCLKISALIDFYLDLFPDIPFCLMLSLAIKNKKLSEVSDEELLELLHDFSKAKTKNV